VVYLSADTWLDTQVEPPALCGLADNPAAPLDVLLELLRTRPEAVPAAFRHRRLPAPVAEAMVDHPNPRVRAALAANHRVDPAVRVLLADDPDREVTSRLRADRDLPLPDRCFTVHLDRFHGYLQRGLLTSAELTSEVVELACTDRRIAGAALRHPQPKIRQALLASFPPFFGDSDHEIVQALLRDESPEVRAAAAETVRVWAAQRARPVEAADLQGNGYDIHRILSTLPLSRALIDTLVTEAKPHRMQELAANPSLPPDVVARLVGYPLAQVRCQAARRADLTANHLTRLAADPDPAVRTAVSVHPDLTEQQRAGIDIDLATTGEPQQYIGDMPTDHPVTQSITWAGSVNPLLRRRAARDPRLPTAVVADLADDTDQGVRVLLAHHHPDAPPAMLLRVFQEHQGTARERLPLLPNFPTAGLSRLATDLDPATRALVARDPQAPPDLVDQLTTDPHTSVRWAMAACPRLPPARIVALLDHPDLAAPAAANPALPTAQMWNLLERG
jgi:hypothetical protein